MCSVQVVQGHSRRPTKRLDFDPNVTLNLNEENLEGVRKLYKRANLADLVMGAVHDFNAHVRSIEMHANLGEEALKENDLEAVARHLGAIVNASPRMGSICATLLHFGSCTPRGFFPLTIREVVEGCVAFLAPIFPKNIEFEVKGDDGGDIEVSGDKHLLEQLLINLIRNAKQAFQRKAGKITIFIHTLKRAEDEVFVPGSKKGYVAFFVADTGSGMSEETLAQIANPFFTTKSSSGGFGLGLHQVKYITHLHGGSVVASTKEGEGSTFTVYLPRHVQ